MAASEHVIADYQTTRLSLKGHPMGFLREALAAEGVASCEAVAAMRDSAAVACAGVVLMRQRPGTGVVCFMTIEDETGVANLVVMPKVFERYRKVVMGARLILVQGRIQRSPEGIVHVLAHRLVDRSAALRRLAEPELPLKALLANADEVVKNGPGGSARGAHASHPRNVRILPPSRDFH
jgi:error-prone DNA polymerase